MVIEVYIDCLSYNDAQYVQYSILDGTMESEIVHASCTHSISLRVLK